MNTKVKSKKVKGKRMKDTKKKSIIHKILYVPKLIICIIIAIILTFSYYLGHEFLYVIVIKPIMDFIKQHKKLSLYIFMSLLICSVIGGLIYGILDINKEKQGLKTYNDSLLESLEETKQQLQYTQEQLNTIQQEYSTKQEEYERQIESLNKKVTSRGSVERTNTQTKQTITYSTNEYQTYAHELCINTYGWTENDFTCLVKLWNRESNWNPNAHNKSSGAHGIPQSLPASKMASEGSDYYTNGKTQIRWGLKYIKNRYGNPTNAWSHSQQKGWY